MDKLSFEMAVPAYLIFSIESDVLNLQEIKIAGEVSLPCSRWEEHFACYGCGYSL